MVVPRYSSKRSHEPASIDLVDVTAPDDSMLSLVTLEGDADVDLTSNGRTSIEATSEARFPRP